MARKLKPDRNIWLFALLAQGHKPRLHESDNAQGPYKAGELWCTPECLVCGAKWEWWDKRFGKRPYQPLAKLEDIEPCRGAK